MITDNIFIREVFGVSASVFVLLSMMIKSNDRKGNIRMRVLNLTGSVLMIIYGLWIGSFSTIFLNVICLVAHIYYLISLFKIKD